MKILGREVNFFNLLYLLIAVLVICLVAPFFITDKLVKLPHADRIEKECNVVVVRSIQNVFKDAVAINFGGGIGVGVGAVQINCISEAGEATVYSSVAQRDDYSVVRRYAHFNEGTMVVFDIIVSGGYCFWGDYFVKDFASEGVVFSGVKTVWE